MMILISVVSFLFSASNRVRAHNNALMIDIWASPVTCILYYCAQPRLIMTLYVRVRSAFYLS